MKLSVITVNLNNAKGLQKTIESVLCQTFEDFEYIVVDGASTDESIEIIQQKNKSANQQIHWISEPDSGIYEAMNKGIDLSKGEYCHFLNSGDYLASDTVYSEIFSHNFIEDIIYGNQIDIFKDKKILNKGYQRSDLTFFDVFNGALYHSSSFTKRSLFFEYGFFDENYKIVSDYIFFVKSIGFGKASVKYIDLLITYFDANGISSQTDGEIALLHKTEDERAYKENFPPRLLELCINDQKKINTFDNLSRYKFSRTVLLVLNKMISYYERFKRM